MPYLNIRKNGAIVKVPLVADRASASVSGVPTLAAFLDGTIYYAYSSELSTNAVAAFRYEDKTHYLVTKHEESEITRWVTLYESSAGVAGTYALPAQYANCPIKIECRGGAGSSGSQGGHTVQAYSARLSTTSSTYYYTTLYIYGGGAGSGGSGGSAETYIMGGCAAGAVFTISLANGGAGSSGNAGSVPTEISLANKSGGSGGAGGIGYSVSVTGADGTSYSCAAYGGGGGGGGGGAGACGINMMLYSLGYPIVPRYTYPTGTGGKGGSSGSVSGSSGAAGQTGDTSNNGRIDLSSYWVAGGTRTYNVVYNSSYSYGRGGAGASSGSSTTAYCCIKAGLLR